jgi:hypothetical protein
MRRGLTKSWPTRSDAPGFIEQPRIPHPSTLQRFNQFNVAVPACRAVAGSSR